MADGQVALPELLDKTLSDGEVDVVREVLTRAMQLAMEAEVAERVGAEKYERSPERVTQRNGCRSRTWDTRAVSILLQIPKLREGTYFPRFLEPRRRSERGIVAVILSAYVHGVSTRHVEDLVQAKGLTGVSKSEVSRIARELDAEVEAFRTRPLTARCPHVWLDAMYEKVRENGRVVSQALIVAVGVSEEGRREVLGLMVGLSEDEEVWKEFLRSLVARGLTGVALVVSDAHKGLKRAIAAVLTGAVWQRCKVHFLRNVAARVSRSAQGMVLAAVKNIFVQPDKASARKALRQTAEVMEEKFPRVYLPPVARLPEEEQPQKSVS